MFRMARKEELQSNYIKRIESKAISLKQGNLNDT